MPDPNTPAPTSMKSMYVATSIGVFALVVVDSLRNGNAATAIKIGDAIQRLLATPDFGYEGTLALIFLMLMACAWCWMERPASLKEAFIRGFTIFAFLTVAAPYETGEKNLNATATNSVQNRSASGFGLIGAAHAQEPRALSSAIIRLPEVGQAEVILRDADSGAILARGVTAGNEIKVAQPSGSYLLEIEAPGYRRTKSKLKLNAPTQQFSLPLSASQVPLGLQRYYAPDTVQLKPEK